MNLAARVVCLLLVGYSLDAEPLFTLFDCTGHAGVCEELFPGAAAKRDSNIYEGPFVHEDRTVVAGVDLGRNFAVYKSEEPSETFIALFYRAPYVLGWHTGGGEDLDGCLIKWSLEGQGASVVQDGALCGSGPSINDVNATGLAIGGGGTFFSFPAYYDGDLLSPDSLAGGWEVWNPRLVNIEQTRMLRVNDLGQVLAEMDFWEQGEQVTRQVVLTPEGVAAPHHMPEPSTALLLLVGIVGIKVVFRLPVGLRHCRSITTRQ